MGFKRTALGGIRDYTSVSLKDIRSDLERWAKEAKRTSWELNRFKKEVKKITGAVRSPSGVLNIIEFYKSLIDGYKSDLIQVVVDIDGGVRHRDIDILKQIQKSSRLEEDGIQKTFYFGFDSHVGSESFREQWDDISAAITDMLFCFHNLGGLIPRLRVFLRLSESKLSQKRDEKKISKHTGIVLDVPPGTKWIDVRIVLIESDDAQLFAGDKCFGAKSFEALGFADKRTKGKRPDKIWQDCLLPLALAQGDLKYKDILIQTERYKLRKHMSILRKRLKEIFGLAEEPFYGFQSNRSYKTKFKIAMLGAGPLPSGQEPSYKIASLAEHIHKTKRHR
jgi:hypothetical protein